VLVMVSFAALLLKHGQSVWTTSYRLKGLLLVIDYLARKDCKAGQRSAAARLGNILSKLEKSLSMPPNTEREVMPLLCRIGVAVHVADAVSSWHVKASTAYRLTEHYRKRLRKESVTFPPRLAAKLENAEARCEHGLNQQYPHRPGVLGDLARLSFAQSARPLIEQMRLDP
jgi:hypothetical protein